MENDNDDGLDLLQVKCKYENIYDSLLNRVVHKSAQFRLYEFDGTDSVPVSDVCLRCTDVMTLDLFGLIISQSSTVQLPHIVFKRYVEPRHKNVYFVNTTNCPHLVERG